MAVNASMTDGNTRNTLHIKTNGTGFQKENPDNLVLQVILPIHEC